MLQTNGVEADEIAAAGPNSSLQLETNHPTTSTAERPSTSTTRKHIWSRNNSPPPPPPPPSQPSLALLDESPKPIAKPKKGIFTFFTLKEPSTSAWADFAKQQRTESASRSAAPTGFQSKQLPDNVPKVNSKWDGMPSTAQSTASSRPSTQSSWKRSIFSSASNARPSTEQNHHSKSPSEDQSIDIAHPFRRVPIHKDSSSTSSSATLQRPFSNGRPGTQDTVTRSDDQQLTPQQIIEQHPEPLGSHPLGGSITQTNYTENDQADVDFSPPPNLSLRFPEQYASENKPDHETLKTQPSLNTVPESIKSPSPVPNLFIDAKNDSPILPGSETFDSSARPYHRQPRVFHEIQPSTSSEPPTAPSPDTAHVPTISIQNTASSFIDPIGDFADAPDIPRYSKSSSYQNIRSDSLTKSSPQARLTSNDSLSEILTTTQGTEESSSPLHSRKGSTENASRWPLASLDAGPAESSETAPPLPPKSTRRLSASSMDSETSAYQFPTILDIDSSPIIPQQTDGSRTSPDPSAAKGSPTSRFRSFSRPLPRSHNAVPVGTVSIVRDNTTYIAANARSAPAFQPGRVITKDSDLATIPESETSSMHSSAAEAEDYNDHLIDETASDDIDSYDGALRTTMYLDTDDESELDEVYGLTYYEDEDEDEDEDAVYNYQAAAGSQDPNASPQIRAPPPSQQSWLEMSSRERLGLGGSIRKESDRTPPWHNHQDTSSASKDSPVLGHDFGGNGSRRSSLLGVFKRNSGGFT